MARDDRKLVQRAVRESIPTHACRRPARVADAVVGDAPLLPEIAALLPALTVPAGDRAVAAALRPPVFGRGLILRSTARVVQLAGGVELRIYVQQGRSFAAAADPKACAKAKLRRVRELAVGRSPAALAAAERQLAAMDSTERAQQTLFVIASTKGSNGGGGSGTPVAPGTPLRPGIVMSGSDRRGGHRYVGIAGPRTARVLVEPARGRGRAPRVVQGFYSFSRYGGRGRVRMREVDAAGVTVRSFWLRR